MKREILCIRNVNFKYSNAVHLKDISLNLMEGESTAFLGLASSGKDALLQVLVGNEWSGLGTIIIDNIKIHNSEELSHHVHRIIDLNYSISNWTVAEYIGLVEGGFFPLFLNKKKLIEDIQQLFFDLDLDIDVTKKISELSELDRKIVDLAKACRKKTKILIIEDEFDGTAVEEIIMFKRIMNRIINGKMTVIVNTHSDSVNNILADNFIIFKNGYIIKKCRKDYIKDNSHLEYLLLGYSGISGKDFNINSRSGSLNNKAVYSLSNITAKNTEKLQFSFNSGETAAILTLNRKLKERIFNLLSGREIDKNIDIVLNKKPCNFNSISDFVGSRIVSGVTPGSNREFLDKMTIGENIIIPSLQKLSLFRYIFNGSKITRILEKQLKENCSGFRVNIEEDETNHRILIIMERWFVLKPKVLVLLEPFLHCDVYGASIIKSYIKKFTDMGTAVIIVKAREKDIADITSKFIKL